MPFTDRVSDSLARAMADRLLDTGADLDDLDSTVRVLLEGRFLAREILPRLDVATGLARRLIGAEQGRAAA